VKNEFAALGSNVIAVTPGKQETTGMIPIVGGSFKKLSHENAKEIKRKIPEIKYITANCIGSGNVHFGTRRRSALLLGVLPEFAKVRETVVQVGRFIEENDIDKNNRVCVIGARVKQELFGDQNALNEKVSINRSKHTIVGILEQKGMMLGVDADDIVMIPLPSAQRLFNGGNDEVMEILVSTRMQDDIKPTIKKIREILTAAHDYTEDFTVTDQDAMIGTFGKIFDVLRFFVAGVACISLLVGGIGIMNIMLVSVRERTREVGIRKAVGARARDIGMQFLVESITLSVFGGLIGIFLGWIGGVGANLLYPSLPISLSAWSAVTAFVFSVVVGVFFGVYPAMKAAAVDPVIALRYE
jgi:putative ABC transport system permease protein